MLQLSRAKPGNPASIYIGECVCVCVCVKKKGSFYIAQYPVQSALHFCPPWQTCSFRHQLGFSGKHSSDAAITRKD